MRNSMQDPDDLLPRGLGDRRLARQALVTLQRIIRTLVQASSVIERNNIVSCH